MTAPVLLVCDGSAWSRRAATLIETRLGKLDIVSWDHGVGPRPRIEAAPRNWIFSFKSDLILAPEVISSARVASVNFHPATPAYRGVGGYFHALESGDTEFGATCHMMDEFIDHGPILRVLRYTIRYDDDARTLRDRSAQLCLRLLDDFLAGLDSGKDLLQPSGETWGKRLYTRSMLSEDCVRALAE